MKILITCEHHGQPRPYADSVYSGWITIERDGELLDHAIFYQEISQELAATLAKLFIRKWEDSPGALGTRLQELTPIGPTVQMIQAAHPKWKPKLHSRWYVKVVQPYLD